MSVSYIKAVETENFEEFKLAREQFGFILNELISVDKAYSEHGDIEFFLDEEGNELIRRMLQGYLLLLALINQNARFYPTFSAHIK